MINHISDFYCIFFADFSNSLKSKLLYKNRHHMYRKYLVFDTMFSIKDSERTNKARELSYHSDERFFKDLSDGHIVFVFKLMY